MEEKKKNVGDIVAKVTKKKAAPKGPSKKTTKTIGKKLDDEEPLNEYMAGVIEKRKKNQAKLKSLGLGTPISQKTRPKQKCKTPISSPQSASKKGPKQSPKKKRTRTSRKIFEDDNLIKVCTCDHKDISSFKEETDKRYFQDGGELNETCCATCGVKFVNKISDNEEAVIVPDIVNPAYFCIGRWKFDCKHGHCRSCYFELLNAKESSRSRRNRAD